MAFLQIKEYEKIELETSYTEKKSDIMKMFKIQEQVINSANNKIQIDATKCTYISSTCLAIFSSIALISKDKDIKISFTRKSKLLNTLTNNGFINIDYNSIGNKNNIPLNKINNEEEANVIIQKLINLSQLKDLNEDQKALLHSRIFEIPNNALTHSNSEYGIICHGYYNNRKNFTFSIYDLGIGIPQSVRNYKKEEMNSIDALKWAFEKGNTTKESDYPRGLGFTLLEEFRKDFKGKITIITENILYTARENGDTSFTKLNKNIKGTLFTLKISV